MAYLESAHVSAVKARLARAHGEAEAARIEGGIESAAALWRESDGSPAAFADFCAEWFLPRGPSLDALYARLATNLEEILGLNLRISKRLQWALHVDGPEPLPVDDLFAAWDPAAHILEDWFASRLAFVIRLNFPRKSLSVKLERGPEWTRREWAEARLGEFAAERFPAEALLALGAAQARAESYIAGYNFHVGNFRDAEGALYAEPKRLLMHWNMRDEIKALYDLSDARLGLRRQRALFKAMERVVDGRVPLAAIDGAAFGWNPFEPVPEAQAEGPARYSLLLDLFRAEGGLDAASPETPSLLSRSFDSGREISVERATALLESLFAGDTYARAADCVRSKLGRPLEAFDIWYRGSEGGNRPDEASLDAATRALFPDAAAFGAAIPSILRRLGFEDAEAEWLAARIEVDAARGSGHAMPAAMRQDKPRLRTRVGAAGMDYKGFNIAMHELGHNVEQVYSLHGIDEYFLAGVPNNAFTEAFAFVFQARDLEVLAGLLEARPSSGDEGLRKALAAFAGGTRRASEGSAVLEDYWQACEIAGVSLVDIALWRWLYAHPGASAEELREATLALARETWNRLFAPAFGIRDSTVLAFYSHMIEYPLYLTDYPLGHLVAFQIEAWLEGKILGREMGRMCRLGKLTPDEWMRKAVGGELSAVPLVEAARKALG